MKRWLAVVMMLISTQAVVGCLGSKQAWTPGEPVVTSDVCIVLQHVFRRKNRLFVRMVMMNLTSSALTVHRDALTLRLNTGRTLQRSSGMTTTHKPYDLAPGASREVWVDFRSDDIPKGTSAQLLWKDAVFAGTRAVEIPDTPIFVGH
ncbi:MAG: hypothetical protein FWD69_05465 [Polyangiaceae bacterium]|nr:hypothetical protein [Polyangiaceae bacterium]